MRSGLKSLFLTQVQCFLPYGPNANILEIRRNMHCTCWLVKSACSISFAHSPRGLLEKVILSDPSPLPLCLMQCLAHDWHQSCICYPFFSPFSLSFWSPHKLQFKYHFFREHFGIRTRPPFFKDTHVLCLGLNDHLCPNSFCPGPLCTSERLGAVRRLIDLRGEAAWLLTPWEPWGSY